MPTTASMLIRIALLCCLALGALPAAAQAQASPYDPNGFRYSSPVYTVHENAGAATITIVRNDTSKQAWIRYIALPGTAVKNQDFTVVKSILSFAPGQSSASFQVPIVDHGVPGLPKTVELGMFGAYPIGVGTPSNATLTIINDDSANIARSVVNPLGLTITPPATDPLTGANPFVDWKWSLAAIAERHLRAEGRAHDANLMDLIAREPEVMRWGNWTPASKVGLQVSQYFERASIEQPGTVPEISTYWIQNNICTGTYSDPPRRVALYHRWIENMAQGIGDYRAIVFLEEDSIITMGCLSAHGKVVREHELSDAISILSRLPRTVVYLDAGAGDALSARRDAKFLNRSGVSKIQGFFLNSTHTDWTLNEIHYGERVSRMTGGKHFVVNTAENGRGPLVPHNRTHHGNEVLCNAPGRGLGPRPTFDTGYPNVDAFAWIARPGESGGKCRPGAPPVGVFWVAYALSLAKHAVFTVH